MGDRVAALRRKLDALAYAEPLEPGSAALAERLLCDLVATTESWRALKLRDAARGQQLAAFQAQARATLPFEPLHQGPADGAQSTPGAGARNRMCAKAVSRCRARFCGPAGGPCNTAEVWHAPKLCV